VYTRHLQVVEAVCFSIHEVANRKLCPPQGSQLFCQGSTVHFKQPGIIPQRHNFLMLGTRTNIWVPKRESLNAGFSARSLATEYRSAASLNLSVPIGMVRLRSVYHGGSRFVCLRW